MSFGNKLFELRTKHGFSQEKLADLLNVSALTIHRWEYDKSAPNIHQVKEICEIFQVSATYFFEKNPINEGVIEEASITENFLPIQETTEGIACEKERKVALFMDKWYLWMICTPWFIILTQAFENSTSFLIFGVPCICILFLSLVQEMIYRYAKGKYVGSQYAVSVIKCTLLVGVAIAYFCVSASTGWKIFFLITASLSIAMGMAECIVVKRAYEFSNEEKKKIDFLTIVNIPFWIFIYYWSALFVYVFRLNVFSPTFLLPCVIFLLCTGAQEWIYRLGTDGGKEKQFAFCLVKYLTWAVYAVFYIWMESGNTIALYIGALFVTVVVGFLEWRRIQRKVK